MKSVVLTMSMLAMAASAVAQQPAIDHSHMHDMQAPAAQAPGAPQAPAPAQAPGAPGGGRGGPQIDVPWNDAIPPGTAEHAARALKESSRHGEWADVKMADVDCVLVVGGAARPIEVAQVLAGELARPVITAPDPKRTIADGAAIIARRSAAAVEESGSHDGRTRRRATRALLARQTLSQRTRRRLTKVAIVAGISASVVAGSAQVGGR